MTCDSTVGPQKRYTWNCCWIHEYESPWSIFEKFKLANITDDIGILGIFGSQCIKRKTKNFYSFSDRNLVSLEGFDAFLLDKILGINLKEHNRQNIQSIISPFGNTTRPELFVDKNIRFCPECIKEGYHSIFHQINLWDECPFHNIPLINRCPGCLCKIPYLLSNKQLINPYTCSCGYKIYNAVDFFAYNSDWISHHEPAVNKMEIKVWMNMDNEQKEYLKELFLKENLINTHLPILIRCLDSAIDTSFKEDLMQIKHYHICNKTNKSMIMTRQKYDMEKFSNCSIDKYNIEYYKLVWKTFRGVEEFINKYIVTKVKGEYLYNKESPYTYAYLLWKTKLEAFEYYFNHRSELEANAWCRNDFFKHSDELQVLEDFYYEMKKHFLELNERNIDSYEWTFNRYLCFILIAYFLVLVKHCEMCNDISEADPSLLLTYKNLPFYVLKIKKLEENNNDYDLELHWWIKSG